MSASWWLTMPDAKDGSFTLAEFNLSYNLGAMLREAGWPTRGRRDTWWDPASFSTDTPDPDAVTNWDVLDEDRRAGDLGEMVAAVVANLEADPERFKALNPPNGWGDYDGCLKTMRDFLDTIERWPDAKVGASL